MKHKRREEEEEEQEEENTSFTTSTNTIAVITTATMMPIIEQRGEGSRDEVLSIDPCPPQFGEDKNSHNLEGTKTSKVITTRAQVAQNISSDPTRTKVA